MNTNRTPAALGKGQTGFGNDHTPKFTITPHSCIRFDKCNANVCPLDKDWISRTHLRGESICTYLGEYVKPSGRAILGGYIPEQLLDVIARAHPSIINAYGDIRRRLKRAITTPSKLGRRPGECIGAAA